MNVGGGDFFDAFHEDILRIDPESIGQRGENDRLVRGIPAIHIQRGIRLRVAEFLGLREDRSKIQPLIGHPAQNIIARAIEDSMDGLEAVSHKGLAHGFDDRNSARHGRLVEDWHTLLGS